jgi:hypothetical protein
MSNNLRRDITIIPEKWISSFQAYTTVGSRTEAVMRQKCYIIGILCMILAISLVGCNSSKSSSDSKKDRTSNAIKQEGEGLEENEIAFAQKGYFYHEDLLVDIVSAKPCEIYYTMDGTEPSRDQVKYKKPIRISAENSIKVTVIKAKGYFEDGSETDTIVHTYFVGKNIDSRYDTLIFSISTDPYNLYDYEYGIFVEGKLRDDWIRENPGDKIEPNDPANFNMRGRESEREVFLEVIQPDGTPILAQHAGVRTHGGWSRARQQKSVKLYARKEYDSENKRFRYEFFPQKKAADNTPIDSFKHLILRNCGNDNGFAFIRDELFQTLAGKAGYQDYQAVRPAAVYVNGSYRGFFWLHEVIDNEYFEYTYGDYNGSFQVIEGGETFKEIDEDGEDAAAVKEYTELYDKFSRLDLTEEKNYEELSKLIDVENYLKYYALQIYIDNEDWPHNNYKCYRYYAAEGEQYREAPFDGKWRYLLHDLDFSTDIYESRSGIDNISSFIGPNGEIQESCPLFGQLMRREDCKEIFIVQTLDLMNGVFAPDYFNKVLSDMEASRNNELTHTYGRGLLDNWVQPEYLPYQMKRLREYMKQRGGQILDKYQEYFKLGNTYTLKVEPAEEGSIRVNSFFTDQSFTGIYYENYAARVTAVLPEDKELDYWLVNGEKVNEEELVISAANIHNGEVIVSCIIK